MEFYSIQKNTVTVEHIESLEINDIEAILCKIGKGESKFHLGLYYRPQNNAKDTGEAMFKQIYEFCKNNAVVIGDFNFPGIDWQTMQVDSLSSGFRDMCLDSFLF